MASLVLHHFWPWQVHRLWDMHARWCSFILAGWRGWVGSTDINLVFLNWRLIGIQGNLAYTLKISWMCSPSGENIPGPCCCCPFCWSINLSPTHLSKCHGSWCENLCGRGKVLEGQKSPKMIYIFLEIHKIWSTHWPSSFWGDVKNFQLCKCVFSLFLFWQLNKAMFNFNGNKELEKPYIVVFCFGLAKLFRPLLYTL